MIELCGHRVGPDQPLFVLAGPDVIESEEMVRRIARRLASICERLNTPFALKCSFDKANRTSGKSYRGPGLVEGLEILRRIKKDTGVSLLTDVHEAAQVEPAAEVADVLQIPAFLCRQTDLIQAAARTGRGLNLKKGQFVAPQDIVHSAQKAFAAGNSNVLVTERGACFGYNNLVVDMRSFSIIRDAGLSVCFDATHSVQLPSAREGQTGGERKFVAVLARAAAASGIDALFAEVHEDPDQALCDGPCALTPEMFEAVLKDVLAIRRVLHHQV
jgi:2-dehydro-3-deoxyphosphooctonate aldolase (KDO 8-P synthase)